jgi:hypothetical protein
MVSRRVLLSVPLFALSSRAGAAEGWTTYQNARYGTTLDYPRRFRPGREPDNGDGLVFTAPDGATLRVWGSLNVEERDIAGLEAFLREAADKDERITYRAAGASWLVLSGLRGGNLFYTRYLFSHRDEVINAFDIAYPQARKAEYDPIVTRMARSLKGGRGFQVRGKP